MNTYIHVRKDPQESGMSLRHEYRTLLPEAFDNHANYSDTGPQPAERASSQPGDDHDDAGHASGDQQRREPSPQPSVPCLPAGILRRGAADSTHQPAAPTHTDAQLHVPADPVYLPPSTGAPANSSPPSSSSNTPRTSRAPTPQPSPQPSPRPALRKSTRVTFKPQPLIVGDPSHPYWQAHHSRPRIPTPRGEGR